MTSRAQETPTATNPISSSLANPAATPSTPQIDPPARAFSPLRPRKLTWEGFEQRLASALDRMAVGQYVVIQTWKIREEESVFYVQFARRDWGLIGEAVANHYLEGDEKLTPEQERALVELGWEEPAAGNPEVLNFHRDWENPWPPEAIARLAVVTLRDVYGVGCPAFLIYNSDVYGTDQVPVELDLGLYERHDPDEPRSKRRRSKSKAKAKAPDGPTVEPEPAAPMKTPEQLRRHVERLLSSILGEPVKLDDELGCQVRIDHALMQVKIVETDPPVVRVFAVILDGVEPSPALLEEINRGNTLISFARFLFIGGRVIVSTELRANDMTEEELAWSLVLIDSFVEPTANHLAAHLGSGFFPMPAQPFVA